MLARVDAANSRRAFVSGGRKNKRVRNAVTDGST